MPLKAPLGLSIVVVLTLSATDTHAEFQINNLLFQQSNWQIAPALGENRPWAQTFTAPSDGPVDLIGLDLLRNSNAISDVEFRLVSTNGDEPASLSGGDVLFHTTITNSQIPLNQSEPNVNPFPVEPVLIDVSSANIELNAGDRLAIVLSGQSDLSDASQFVFWFAGSETYDGGLAFRSPDDGVSWDIFQPNIFLPEIYDFAFTVNAIPAPAGLLPLIGACLMQRRGRRA